MQKLKLKSGNEIPILGLGTWQLSGKDCKEAVKKAIKLGYTHIDTALIYENQEEIGEALKEIKVDRAKLFITSKVWRDNLDYHGVLGQCDEVLYELGVDYVDLLLIHWPNSLMPMGETFKAFKELISEGKVKQIGVSNFTINHLKKAMEVSEVPITVNQVEYHPYLNQEELLNFCKKNNIILTAYSPLARGEVFKDNLLKEIAEKYNKSAAQVTLRWLIQKGIVVIPKSKNEKKIKENKEIFDFKLKREDVDKINNIKIKKRLVNPAFSEF